jgi:hypothetical protein
MTKAKVYRELAKPERGIAETAYKAVDVIGRGGGILTGASDIGNAVGANTPNMPGDYLVMPAVLFTIGQATKTVNDYYSDPEWFKEMPFLYKLPRHAQRFVSAAMPLAAAGFLAFGNREVADAGALGSAGTYIFSEVGLDKVADWVEGKYLDRHPEIVDSILEGEMSKNK